jgi:hypothetical protein
MREAQEVERLRFTQTPLGPSPGGVPPELDQPGLVRVQFQPEPREPIRCCRNFRSQARSSWPKKSRMSASSTQFTRFCMIPTAKGVQRIMRTTPGPEPVGQAPKIHLVDCVKHLDDGPLNDLVLQRGNTQRPQPPVRLRYIGPPARLGPVAPRPHPLVQVLKVGLQPPARTRPTSPGPPPARPAGGSPSTPHEAVPD